MPFCHNCGSKTVEGAKFCNNCGVKQVAVEGPAAGAQTTDAPKVESAESETKTLDINALGKSLEAMTEQILKGMNYRTQMRQRLEDKAGNKHEIDVVATRGSRLLPVECKNFGEDYSVGIEHLRNFRQKLTDLKVGQGLFVTNVTFTRDGENFAHSHDISLWDGQELREKFFSVTLGRLSKTEAVTLGLALPSLVDFSSATALSLTSPGGVKVSQAQLVYYPYYKVHFKLKAVRFDPVRDRHVVQDEGTYIIDGIDGSILNPEEGVGAKVLSVFKKSEVKEARKLDKMVAKDVLEVDPEEDVKVIQTSDYEVRRIKPEVKEKTALKTVVERVISRNVTEDHYEVRVGRDKAAEKKKFKIIPRADEVSIKEVPLVYVPSWDVEFESGPQTYSRRILSSSQQPIKDEIAFCPSHFQLGGLQLVKKLNVGVCKVCGRAFCQEHIISPPDGNQYCEEDVPEEFKPKEPEKKSGLGFKLPFGKG